MIEKKLLEKELYQEYLEKLKSATDEDMIDDCKWDYQEKRKKCGLAEPSLKDYVLFYDDEAVATNPNEAYMGVLKLDTEYRTKALEILEYEFKNKHNKGGRKSKLTVEMMLDAFVEYFNLSPISLTYKQLAQKYYIHESNMYETIIWVKNIFIKYNLLLIEDDSDEEDASIVVTIFLKKLMEVNLQ